jgi:thioredoxin reductase (NADPH)
MISADVDDLPFATRGKGGGWMMGQFLPLILVADEDPAIADTLRENLATRVGPDFEVVVAISERDAERVLHEAASEQRPTALLVACLTFGNLIDAAPQIDPMVRIVASHNHENAREARMAVSSFRVHDAGPATNDFEYNLGRTATRLLDAWRDLCDPRRNLAVLLGDPFGRRMHLTSEFLRLCQVAHHVVELASHDARPFMHLLNGGPGPLVVSPGQWTMYRPDIRELALAFDKTNAPRRPTYDVVVVGAGPGGMNLAQNLGAEGVSALVVEADVAGGQAARSSNIRNYGGFPDGIAGRDLMANFLEQARNNGAEIIAPYRAQRIEDAGAFKRVVLETGEEVYAREVVIATGVRHRFLDVPNIGNLVGRGVYHGASVHGLPEIAGQDVVVNGGGNSAGQAALKLAETAGNVYLVIRGGNLEKSMSQYLIDDINDSPNIHVLLNTEVAAALGSSRLDGVVAKNKLTGVETEISTNHLMVFIGSVPNTEWLDGLVECNERGQILTGHSLEDTHPGAADWAGAFRQYATSCPGIRAIGDCHADTDPRVANAAGDASVLAKGLAATVREMRRSEAVFTGPDEVVRAKLDAETLDDARGLIRQTLVGDRYRLEPTEKTDVWRLCQVRGRAGKYLDHIATVSLKTARRGEKTNFVMWVAVPQEHLIGSPEDRNRQAKAWVANIAEVASERAQILKQQRPYHVKPAGLTLAS